MDHQSAVFLSKEKKSGKVQKNALEPQSTIFTEGGFPNLTIFHSSKYIFNFLYFIIDHFRWSKFNSLHQELVKTT